MDTLLIEGTSKTPTIKFNTPTGCLEISGRSIPENSVEFYAPIIKCLEQYCNQPNSNTEANIQLEYFNTSSSKCILDIFKKLERIYKAGNKVTINWYYEADDEDMLEAGQDYETIIKVPFKMLVITE